MTTPTTTPATTPAAELLADLIGVRYLERGTDPARGLDCYGMVRVALARVGLTLPARPEVCLAAALADKVPAGEACRPFDILDAVGGDGRRHLLVALDAFGALHAAPATGVVRVEISGWRRARLIRAVLRPRGLA